MSQNNLKKEHEANHLRHTIIKLREELEKASLPKKKTLKVP